MTNLSKAIYCFRLLLHFFHPRKKSLLWPVTHMHVCIWRQIQRIRMQLQTWIKSLVPKSNSGHNNSNYTKMWDLGLGSGSGGSGRAGGWPYHGSRGPGASKYIDTFAGSVDLASGDSSSEIEIRVVSPDESGDASFDSTSRQGFETEISHDISELPSHIDNNSVSNISPGSKSRLSIYSSHSSHSSRSFASSRDISLQSIRRPLVNGSRSIIISPQLESDSIRDSRVQVDLPLKVADHIRPLLPSKLERYKRKRPIATREEPCPVSVPPNTRDFTNGPDEGALPAGWTQSIHPEGQPIFYNKAKRIITESWIFSTEIYTCLEQSHMLLKEFIEKWEYTLPENCDLVMEIDEDMEVSEHNRQCRYYYVSHKPRVIFWMEEFDIGKVFIAGNKVSDVQIHLQLEFQYWLHWSFFPDISPVTLSMLDIVSNHISDIRTDLLTSPEQTIFQLSLNDVKNWETSIKDARRQLSLDPSARPTGWFVGRFMSELCWTRFHNFYGTKGARLARTQTVFDFPKRHQTYLIRILSPLLFLAPEVHLKIMEDQWVDRLALKKVWSKFFAQLLEEWKSQTAYALILLNANVAFLAIPSNDQGDNSKILHRSIAQVGSYTSIVTSSASMLLGLLLVRQYQTRDQCDVMNYKYFLVNNYHSKHGHEALAILYSLPYALLIWGLVTFFLAFLSMCFQSSDTTTRSIVGITSTLTGALIVWCIWKGWKNWEDSQEMNLWSVLLEWLSRRWKRVSKAGQGWNYCIPFRQFRRNPTALLDAESHSMVTIQSNAVNASSSLSASGTAPLQAIAEHSLVEEIPLTLTV